MTLKREAVNETDVLLCTTAFEDLFLEAKRLNQPVRILVQTQNVKVHVLHIKMDIVNMLREHFQAKKKEYLPLVRCCAIVVDNIALAGVIQPIITLVCNDKRILVTAQDKVAKQFLSK